MADRDKYIDPNEGAVGKTTRHYRALVAQTDRDATLTLSNQYERIAEKLSSQLETVLADIARVNNAGMSPTFTQMYKRERLGMLLQDVGTWFDEAGRSIGLTMSPAVQTAVQLGQDAAGAAINARLTGNWKNPPTGSVSPPGTGASISFNSLPRDAIEEMAGVLQPGSPVAELLDSFGTKATEQARSILTQGVAEGINPERLKKELANTILPQDVASELDDVVKAAYRRALTIARTEIWRAYRTANLRTYRANDHLVRNWVWRAHLGPTTCAACLAMNGTIHPLDEDMGSHPACRCVCAPVTVTRDELYAKYGLTGERPPERSAKLLANQPGDVWLRNQPDDAQNRVLGSSTAGDLFRAGQVELNDFVVIRRSEQWGTTHSRGSARQALAKAEKRRERDGSPPATPLPRAVHQRTDATPATVSRKDANTGGHAIPVRATHPLNPAVRKDANGIWGGDELPVMEWEAPEARVVIPKSVSDATGARTSVLRLSRSKQAQMLQKRPGTETLLASLDELLPGWTHMGQESADAEVWRVIFPGEGHQNQLVFGPDRAGSWNVITAHPLRAKQQELLQAQPWMRERGDE